MSTHATCLVGRTPAFGDGPTYAALRDALVARPAAHSARGRLACSRERATATPSPPGSPPPPARRLPPGRSRRRPGRCAACSRRSPADTAGRSRPRGPARARRRRSSTSSSTSRRSHAGRSSCVVLARPELLDTRPDWGGGGLARLVDPARRSFGRRTRLLLDRLAERARSTTEAGRDPRRGGGQPALPRAAPRIGARGGRRSFRTRSTRCSPPASTGWAGGAPRCAGGSRLRTAVPDRARRSRSSTTDVRRALVQLSRRDFVEPERPDPFGRSPGSSGMRSSATRPMRASQATARRAARAGCGVHRGEHRAERSWMPPS